MNRAPKGAVLPNQKQPPDFSARLFFVSPDSPKCNCPLLVCNAFVCYSLIKEGFNWKQRKSSMN